MLQRVQEKVGYLPEAAIREVAHRLRLSPSEVYGVATFYNFFRLKPAAANLVQVCRGTACHVRGGPRILETIRRKLGIEVGESSADMKFGLETVACIGACALAPNVVMNGQPYGKMTAKKATDLLSSPPSESAVVPGTTGSGRSC